MDFDPSKERGGRSVCYRGTEHHALLGSIPIIYYKYSNNHVHAISSHARMIIVGYYLFIPLLKRLRMDDSGVSSEESLPSSKSNCDASYTNTPEH